MGFQEKGYSDLGKMKIMICRTGLLVLLAFLLSTSYLQAQAPEILISKVRAKLEKVNDYVAKGKMKTNVIFIKAPVASVKIFYKRPDKMRINNETGISFIPKGSVNINLNNIFTSGSTEFDLIDLGRENGTNLRVIKMLPRDENSDVVLSTLYIDEARALIIRAKTTTREEDDNISKQDAQTT